MTKVRVFLSFEFDKDSKLHRNFYTQAEEQSYYNICDYSLNEAYQPHSNEWLQKTRNQICQSDIVIVMVGEDTYNAPGVEKEVTIANQLKKPIFQIMPQEGTGGEVRGVEDLIEWKWKEIDEKMKELLN